MLFHWREILMFVVIFECTPETSFCSLSVRNKTLEMNNCNKINIIFDF